MPILGSGIVPAGAVGTELQAITRRAFIPKMVVQIYQARPVLSAALANAQTASGGISQITLPVQGNPLVTAQATDYSGSFSQPAVQTGIVDAEDNLAAVVVPIPFLGMEGLVQLEAAVIPRIEAVMNDAGNQVADYLNTQLWTNGSSGTINPVGFPLISGTTTTYANINGTTNTWWQALNRAEGAVNPTRLTLLNDIVAATKQAGGEAPNFGVTGPGTWALLAQDYVGQEQYMITPDGSFDKSALGARSAFTAIMVMGVPIYFDLSAPEGQILFFNTRYFAAYIHEAAAFAFTGWASTLPTWQLGYIGVLVCVIQFFCAKRKTVALMTGYNSNSL